MVNEKFKPKKYLEILINNKIIALLFASRLDKVNDRKTNIDYFPITVLL